MHKIALIGVKVGMSDREIFDNVSSCFVRVPVSLVKVLPCRLVGVASYDKVFSLRIAGGRSIRKNKVSKSELGSHFKNSSDVFFDTVREFRFKRKFEISDDVTFQVGDYLVGRKIDVRGTTVGKGFQGVMKRHNFAGLNASHGVSVSHRSHGSVGLGRSWGSGVGKGKKMAGHMGNVNITQKNLEIVHVSEDENIISIKGSVPGYDSGILFLTDTNVNIHHGLISSINNVSVKDLGGFAI